MKEKKFNNAYSKVVARQQTALQHKTVMEDQYDFTISDKPVTIITTDAGLSYNILIQRDSIHDGYFENLVVQVDTLNQTWAYILKYEYKENSEQIGIEKYHIKITPIIYNDSEISSKITTCTTVCGITCTQLGGQYTANHTPGPDCSNSSALVEVCQDICREVGGSGGEGGNPDAGTVIDLGSGGGGSGGSTDLPPPPPNNCSKCNPPVIVAPVEQTEEEKMADHCTKLKALSKNSNAKDALKTLETAVGQNGERGFKLMKSGQMILPVALPVTSTTNNNIRIPSGGIIFGALHSHPFDGSVREMFSANDILALYNIVKNYNYQFTSDNPDSMRSMFVLTVATNNGTYALKIDGMEFENSMNAIVSVKNDKRDFINEFDYLQSRNKNKVAGEQESEFINFVSRKNLGLSIYKAKDSTFSKWNKLAIDPENTKKTLKNPCN